MPDMSPSAGDAQMMYRADYRSAVLKKREREAKKAEREAKRAAMEAELRESRARAAKAAALMVVPVGAKVPVREIIISVAAKHGVTYDDIVSRTRKVHVVKARQEAMKMANSLRPDMSMTELGRQFKRDHTTILHALGRLSRCKK